MNRLLLALAGILLPAAPVMASPGAPTPPSYVAVVRVTPGASPAKILAFQNIDPGQDVIVRRIDIANSSTMTVTGGLSQYWVYAATQVTHSALTTVQTYKLDTALAAAPAAVSASTAPLNVQYEGDSGVLTAAQSGSLTGTSVPLIRPLAVNDDESATASLTDGWGEDVQSGLQSTPLVLPHGSSRALVIEKRQLGSSDFTSGSVTIRIFYTLR